MLVFEVPEASLNTGNEWNFRRVQPTEHRVSAGQSNTTKVLFGLIYVVLVLVRPHAGGGGVWARNWITQIHSGRINSEPRS